jgi:hypothetical protein
MNTAFSAIFALALLLAAGGAQAGRFLRHYVELGMNKDLAGRKVFDGVYSHTAGAGKVFAMLATAY